MKIQWPLHRARVVRIRIGQQKIHNDAPQHVRRSFRQHFARIEHGIDQIRLQTGARPAIRSQMDADARPDATQRALEVQRLRVPVQSFQLAEMGGAAGRLGANNALHAPLGNIGLESMSGKNQFV